MRLSDSYVSSRHPSRDHLRACTTISNVYHSKRKNGLCGAEHGDVECTTECVRAAGQIPWVGANKRMCEASMWINQTECTVYTITSKVASNNGVHRLSEMFWSWTVVTLVPPVADPPLLHSARCCQRQVWDRPSAVHRLCVL